MDKNQILVPDFYPILGLQPGREMAMYTGTMWSVLELEHERQSSGWEDSEQRLKDFYASHDCANQAGSFVDAALAEEGKHESMSSMTTLGRFTMISQPAGTEDEDPNLKRIGNFYGYASDQDNREYARWSSDNHIKRLHLLALDECRRSGSVAVPPHWTPSTRYEMVGNNAWLALIRDDRTFYTSLETERFRAMCDFARSMLTHDRMPWVVEIHGPDWDPVSACEEVSLYTWDAAMTYHAEKRYPETIDTLSMLSFAGPGHLRLDRALIELIDSPEPAVRLRVAEIMSTSMNAGLLECCTRRAIGEEHRVILESLVKALRLHGSEDGFNALYQVAREATSRYARDAATRALAWVPRYPERFERLRVLGRSRDRRTFNIVSKSLAEAKNHGFFSREGEFASPWEKAVHEALKDYLSSQDPTAAEILNDAFRTGRLRIETDSIDPASPASKATLVTDEEIPLHTEESRTFEFLGYLNLLECVDIPGASLTPAELHAERVLHQEFSVSEYMKFRAEDRVRIAETLEHASIEFRQQAVRMLITLQAEAEKESPPRHFIADPINDNQFETLVLILSALPNFSRNLCYVFLKGPNTGLSERIEAVSEACPGLQLYWGYLTEFPDNAAIHIQRWLDMCAEPDLYGRGRLADLPAYSRGRL